MLANLALFIVSLVVLVKSAQYAVKYSARLARMLHLSEFLVSFFIIAFISCFPEGSVSIASAFKGVPDFGLGTLLGSNVADLALVFGIVALSSKNGIKVKSEILRNDLFYLALLLVPILLGYDGNFSRIDGILLLLSGGVFLLSLSLQGRLFHKTFDGVRDRDWPKNLLLLLVSLVFLAGGAYHTVDFGVHLAEDLAIPAFLVALTVVSIGTCVPELVFSLRAVKTGHDELALGDILGTVIVDATILVGIISLIQPFDFDPSIIYVTGVLMFLAGALVVAFIKSGKVLSKREGLYLLMFYVFSLIAEFVANRAA